MAVQTQPLIFTVPDQYAGQSLNQIQQQSGLSFRPDVFGNLAGVDPNTPLTKGQQLTYSTDDPGYANSGEYMSASKLFGAPQTGGQLAQGQYNTAINTAVGGLQTQKSNLATQYGDLLKTVTGEYQPLINTATQGINQNLAARGITNNSPYYASQMTSGLQPITGQEAGNAQQIGLGSVADYNTLTQAIAAMQAGAAGTSSQLPLQYGSLNLASQLLPSQIALNQAQGSYYGGQNPTSLAEAQLKALTPFGVGAASVYNPSTKGFLTVGGGGDDVMSAMKSILAQKKKPMSSIGQYVQQ